MTDDKILQKALQQRASLRKQLVEIEGFIRTFERLADGGEDSDDDEPSFDGRSLSNAFEFQRAIRKSSPIALIENAVRDYLAHARRPASTTDILNHMPTQVVIGGKEPRWNLSAKLSRMPDIVNLKGHGWWLKERPCGFVGYVPLERHVPTSETEEPDEDQSSGPSNESGDRPLNK